MNIITEKEEMQRKVEGETKDVKKKECPRADAPESGRRSVPIRMDLITIFTMRKI